MGTVEAGAASSAVWKGVSMPEIEAATSEPVDEYVLFMSTGMHAKGEFHCAACGYGVTVCRELPRCPMCGGEDWEQSDWSPFGRARSSAREGAILVSGPLV
jgi:hypothetical protein